MKKFVTLGLFLVGNISILLCALILFAFYSSSLDNTQARDYGRGAVLGMATQAPLAFGKINLEAPTISQTIVPADSRAKLVDDFFKKYGSPMHGLGAEIVTAADKYKIPFGYLPAVGMCEGQVGKVIPNDSFNTWGYGVYGGKVLKFNSWGEAIDRVSRGLRQDYFDRGFDNPDKIMTKYTPSSAGSWAFCVNQFLSELQ